MSNQLQNAVHQVLSEVEIPEQISIGEATAFLSHYVSDVEYVTVPESDEEIPEKAIVKEGTEGRIVDVTIVRFSNLRFQLGKLLLETGKAAPTVAAALAVTDPVRKALALLSAGIQFVEKVKPLQAVKVSAREAQLLLIIYRLIQEKKTPTLDLLTEILSGKMSELQIMKSLDVLERLACIERTTDKIILNETIEIEHAA